LQRIRLKRAYASIEEDDGKRILIDRVWPRGVTREKLALDGWLKGIAPSDALRKWFGHDPQRWLEFRRRYFDELESRPDDIAALRNMLKDGPVTLVYGARDTEHNNAVALKEFIERRSD